MKKCEIKKQSFKTFSIVFTVFLFLSGCAATDKKLVKEDLNPINSMTMAQLKSPPLLKETTGSKVAGMTGVMFGAIGGGLGGGIQYKMMESNGKELQEKCDLPNYGERVFKQLVERIPNEVKGWPKIVVKNEPISDESEVTNDYAILVKVKLVKVEDGAGLSAWTTAQLRNPQGGILWEKNVKYETKKFGRQCGLDILEADKGKLLREEYEFAILNTVSTMINDLNGNSPKI